MLREDVTLKAVSLLQGDGVRVLDGVDLALAPGEHVAIVGPSGSGKTSLLRVLSGELQATAGEVQRAGRVASIHQDYRLVGSATALDNALHGAAADVGFWRSLFASPADVRARACEWLQRVGLGERMQQRVDRLSGGEQQRVALARALMRRPSLLLADEPVSALDRSSARALLQLLDALRRQHGITVVSVLHDVALAQEFADRVLTLRDGRLAAFEVADAATTATATAGFRAPASGVTTAAPQPVADVEAAFATARAAEAVPSRWRWLGRSLGAAGVALLCAWAVSALELQWPQAGAGAQAARFVGQLVPDAGEWAAIDWAALGTALRDTLLMAWLATLAAIAFSLPLAAAAARNIAPAWLRVPTRALLNGIRAVPSLLWALLAVGAFGLGALPGIIALAIYSLGYLTKFYYEALESVPAAVPQALRALGMGRAQAFFAGLLPAGRLALLSASVFMLEYNFRTATVLGVVGAGGIGYELKLAIDWGNWHVVGVILAVLVVAVILFDALASRLRRALA
jgi:phosphonate ABC transporter permease subunit PhnE